MCWLTNVLQPYNWFGWPRKVILSRGWWNMLQSANQVAKVKSCDKLYAIALDLSRTGVLHGNNSFNTLIQNWPYFTDDIFKYIFLMLWNGIILLITGSLCGNPPVTVDSPDKSQWLGALMFSLVCAWKNAWVNNRGAGDLRRIALIMTSL